MNNNIQKSCLAAGCFWGVESLLADLEGVISTQVGYTGGHTKDPIYEEVCTDTTGHAEAVLVEFDTNVLSYKKLLQTFFNLHDPTTVNRQGPDVGSQYRSAIYFYNENQKQQATAVRDQLQKKSEQPIVTEITPATTFYPAEDYHQQYFAKRNIKPTCHL